jgi:hypothetical protein
MTPDRSRWPNRRFLGPGMRKAFAGFLVTALAAASATPPCSSSAFAQQLRGQAAVAQAPPEAAASQSAQEPAGQGAANCPGHPDELGTSRVLALDPTEYPRGGRMLPLNDKEVVSTELGSKADASIWEPSPRCPGSSSSSRTKVSILCKWSRPRRT